MFFVKFEVAESTLSKIIDEISKNIDLDKHGNKIYPKKVIMPNGAEKEVSDEKEFLHRLKDNYSFLPTSAIVRKELRKKIREKWGKDELRHFLMGYVQMKKDLQEIDPTRFSAIQVSHAYWNGKNWEFRIWGWIPEKVIGVSRNNIIEFLKGLFNSRDFWVGIFGCECIEKPNGQKYLVEYPKVGWNFIDLGGDIETKEALRDMMRGD